MMGEPIQTQGKNLPLEEFKVLEQQMLLAKAAYADFKKAFEEKGKDPDKVSATGQLSSLDKTEATMEALRERQNISEEEVRKFVERYEVVGATHGSWNSLGLSATLVQDKATGEKNLLFAGTESQAEQWRDIIADYIADVEVMMGSAPASAADIGPFIRSMQEQNVLRPGETVTVIGHSLGGSFGVYTAMSFTDVVKSGVVFHSPGISTDYYLWTHKNTDRVYESHVRLVEVDQGTNVVNRLRTGALDQIVTLQVTEGQESLHGMTVLQAALYETNMRRIEENEKKIQEIEGYLKSEQASRMTNTMERAMDQEIGRLRQEQDQRADFAKQRIQELESVIREAEHRIRRGEVGEDRRETVREKIEGWRQEQKVLNQVVEKHGSVFVKQYPDGSPYHQAEIVDHVRSHQKAHDFVEVQGHGTDSYAISPPVLPLIYKTVEGDSIDALAKALGVGRRDIEALNSHLDLEGIEEVPGGILLNLPTNYRLNERPQTEEEKKVVGQLYVRAYHILKTDSVERVAQIMEVSAAELVRTTPYLSDTLIVYQNTSHQNTPTPLYTVKRGDTISEIAKKTGISAKKIIEDNRIKNADKIIVGQTLIVSERTNVGQNPQKAPGVNQGSQNHFTHVIQKNESLSEIAKKHKTTVKELQEANRIKDPNKIIAGQALIVPEHSATTQTQSVVASTHQQNTPGVSQAVNQGSQNHYIYVIQKNDTLSEVAQRHKTTVRELQAMNNIKDPNKIVTGEHLVVKRSSPPLPPDYYAKSKFDLRPEPNRQVVEPVVREVETHRVEIPWYERYTPPEPPAMSGWSSAEQEMRPDPPSNNSEELLPLWRQLRDPSLIRKLLVSNDGVNGHRQAKTWTWKPEEMEPITREIWSQTGVKMEGMMTVAMDVETAVSIGENRENISSNMDEQLKYSVLQLKKEQKDVLGQSRSSYPSLHHTRCSDVAQLVQHIPQFLGPVSSSPMVLSQTSLSWMTKMDRFNEIGI